MMTLRACLRAISRQEDLNFLLTNRVPRLALTRFMGWFSRLRHPWVRDISLAVWRTFTDLDLSEARKTRFDSLHDCFIRELKPGARPICSDPNWVVSPSDGIVGACGHVQDGLLYQAKGFPYRLQDLLGADVDHRAWQDGVFVTLRLTSAMYHRFHAPIGATLRHIHYFSGDTWNVNPIALKRIEKLFCKNERACLVLELSEGGPQLAVVPVAAILVASLRLHALDATLDAQYQGPCAIDCDVRYEKGQEMGYFQHGSTILLFAPAGFSLGGEIVPGAQIRMGQALLRVPSSLD